MRVHTFEPNIFGLYKPAGWTPLQALVALKRVRPELANISLTYAGRLDPMAEGLLLVLAGEKVHEKNTYLKFDKTYLVTALFGIQTDSYDLLGLPVELPAIQNHTAAPVNPKIKDAKVVEQLQLYVGPVALPLPPYSSPPHKGKPLFWWAKNANISQGETPIRETTVYSIDQIALGSILDIELLAYTQKTIAQVDGDFRQTEVLRAWEQLLNRDTSRAHITVTFSVRCSSGTYIRSLVQDLGTRLDCGACVFRLIRTEVGPYTLDQKTLTNKNF